MQHDSREDPILPFLLRAQETFVPSQLKWASAHVPRPRELNIERDGCGSFFHTFERSRTCTNVTRAGVAERAPRKNFKIGLSLWSPVVPLGDVCVSTLLRIKASILSRVQWLPPKTLGVHVRRGNLDLAW